jgi:hypothetical protein
VLERVQYFHRYGPQRHAAACLLMYIVILTACNGLHHPLSQEGFKSALKSAFEHFLNLKHSQSAYLIAKFVDKQLKGEKGTTEQEVEARLDQVRSVGHCALCLGF